MSQSHVLHRVVFDLHLSDASQAFSEQKRLARDFREDVVVELEKLFDQLVSPHQHVRLQKIEVDIGGLNASNWREKLVLEVRKAIQNQLIEDESVQQTPTQSAGQWLVHFLHEGLFPWWAAGRSLADLTRQLRDLTVETDGTLFRLITAQFRESPVAIERFLTQFPADLADNILAVCQPVAFEYWKQIQRILAPAYQEHRASIGRTFWFSVFGQTRHRDTLIDRLMRVPAESLQRILPVSEAAESEIATFRDIVREVIAVRHEQTGRQHHTPSANQANHRPRSPKEPVTAAFIGNAGLIILAPFLTVLFERTGLISDQAFVDEYAQERAVLLMQYLVKGQTEIDENEVPLNKLLAGLPLEAPIERLFMPNDAEQDELDGLLQSVIEYWTTEWYKQKQTGISSPLMSAETLRETYLQRTGKLSWQPGGDWRLQVEHNTLDLLMPFWRTSAYTRTHTDGFTVKFPWMDHKLVIEWPVGTP